LLQLFSLFFAPPHSATIAKNKEKEHVTKQLR